MSDSYQVQLVRRSRKKELIPKFEVQTEAQEFWDQTRSTFFTDPSLVAAFLFKNGELRDYMVQYVRL